MRVPSRQPTNVNSVRAVNRRLSDEWGNPKILIDKDRCKNLIQDLTQVIWEDVGGGQAQRIKKVKNRNDPYFYRTHATEALAAIVHREWPTRREVAEEEDKRPKPKFKRRKKKLRAEFPT
jgi:hypothetical protein